MTLFNWKQTLHIVRGLPGEGKSTLALALVDGERWRVVENDDFWYVPTLPNYAAQLVINSDKPTVNVGRVSEMYAPNGYEMQGPYLRGKYDAEGFEYQYQRELTHLAANWCGAEAFRRLRLFPTVAVANVFSRREHIFGYLVEARKLGVRVQLHRPQTQWSGDVSECNKKNIHSVPEVMIQKFKDEWEEMSQDEVDILINLPMEFRQKGTP